MQDWVFPFIKNLHADKNSAYSKYMDDAIFKLPTPLVLSKVIDSLDDIYDSMSKSEKKGYPRRCIRISFVEDCDSR